MALLFLLVAICYLPGEVSERPKERDWKSRVVPQALPWVRIPPSPHKFVEVFDTDKKNAAGPCYEYLSSQKELAFQKVSVYFARAKKVAVPFFFPDKKLVELKMAKARAIGASPTPPGPEGSNGKLSNDVPRGTLAFFL